MWGVPTPTIDAVIRLASTMIARNYFDTGLTVEELGIAGMTPQDVSALIA
jgi:opine dehydrogenase